MSAPQPETIDLPRHRTNTKGPDLPKSTGFWEPSAEFKTRLAARQKRLSEADRDEFEDLWDNVPV